MDKNGYVRVLTPEGRERTRQAMPAISQGTPSALAWHPSGHLLVANSHYGEVRVYDPDLRFVRAFGSHGRAPGSFMLLTGIAASPQGEIFVSDQGDDIARVQVFSLEGKALRHFGSYGSREGELNRPMGLYVSQDEVWVADSLNHRVQVFDHQGIPLRRFGFLGDDPGQLKYPYAISLDAQERVYVADFGNDRVQRFDLFGKLQEVVVGPGRVLGKVRAPWCVLVGQGRLFVTDGGGGRLYEGAVPE